MANRSIIRHQEKWRQLRVLFDRIPHHADSVGRNFNRVAELIIVSSRDLAQKEQSYSRAAKLCLNLPYFARWIQKLCGCAPGRLQMELVYELLDGL